ncbi:MAG TPA: hypothetical protein VGV90_05680 [Solirubrobacteraceae bacterium]|nr:hypothetical protein [Solirubrobacteraceae bacterium]
MPVLAALGDAPTAAIAVVAILIGVFLAARGPREKRPAGAANGAQDSGPTLLKVPVAAAPETEPGFVGPAGEVVGHGPIRLGAVGSLGGGEPATAHPAAVTPATAQPEPEPAPPPVPAAPPPAREPPRVEPPAGEAEQALFASPPSLPDAPAAPQHEAAATHEPPAEEDPPPPAAQKGPAWRVAARAASSAVHFRQGTIKLGGKSAKKDED